MLSVTRPALRTSVQALFRGTFHKGRTKRSDLLRPNRKALRLGSGQTRVFGKSVQKFPSAAVTPQGVSRKIWFLPWKWGVASLLPNVLGKYAAERNNIRFIMFLFKTCWSESMPCSVSVLSRCSLFWRYAGDMNEDYIFLI